jgi:lipoprotein-releasing system ATP-binding protein
MTEKIAGGENTILLECKNLTKFYGEEVITRAVNKVSFSLPERSFTAIMGPSGSGKSTLLNLIAGLDIPTSGEIIFAGNSYRSLSSDSLAKLRRKEIGMVYQSFNLLPRMSVLENVCMPLLLDGFSRREAFEKAEHALKQVDLLKHAKKIPAKLSGGEQQRVAIARALVIEPSLILADEPTGNLDLQTGSEILELLQRICKEHCTAVLLVTHDLRAAAIADRLIYMEDGRFLADMEISGKDPNDLLLMLRDYLERRN